MEGWTDRERICLSASLLLPSVPSVISAISVVNLRTPDGSGALDARVDEGVEDVGEEAAEDDEDGGQRGQAHQNRVVALGDRLDGETAHAGPLEDLLGDDGAAEEVGQGRPEQGDDRQQAVAQDVAGDDDALGEALGPSGSDIV